MTVHPLKDHSALAQAKPALVQAMNAVTLLEGTDPEVLAELRLGLGPDDGMKVEEAIEHLRESLWRLKQTVVAQRRGYRVF